MFSPDQSSLHGAGCTCELCWVDLLLEEGRRRRRDDRERRRLNCKRQLAEHTSGCMVCFEAAPMGAIDEMCGVGRALVDSHTDQG